MGLNVELGANVRYTDEDSTQYFYEGNQVTCHVGKDVYTGVITSICYYKESEESEPQPAICIDTSKSKMSYSVEIILLKDITYLCNNIAENVVSSIYEIIGIAVKNQDKLNEEDREKLAKNLTVLNSIIVKE